MLGDLGLNREDVGDVGSSPRFGPQMLVAVTSISCATIRTLVPAAAKRCPPADVRLPALGPGHPDRGCGHSCCARLYRITDVRGDMTLRPRILDTWGDDVLRDSVGEVRHSPGVGALMLCEGEDAR